MTRNSYVLTLNFNTMVIITQNEDGSYHVSYPDSKGIVKYLEYDSDHIIRVSDNRYRIVLDGDIKCSFPEQVTIIFYNKID